MRRYDKQCYGVMVIVCLALILTWVEAEPVAAQEELLIVTGEYPPFHYKEGGKLVGSCTDIVKEVITRMGYIPNIKAYPYKRSFQMIKDGEAAAIYAMSSNQDRVAVMYMTEPLAIVSDMFFKRKADDISWDTMKDLRPYIVGFTEGFNYAERFKTAVKEQIFKVDRITQGSGSAEWQHLMKLKKGRIDLAIMEANLGNFLIKKHAPEFDSIEAINKEIGSSRSYHLGFSKIHPDANALFKQFNAELVKFVAEGKRQAIQKTYGLSTAIDAESAEWEIPDHVSDWDIAENTFDPPFVHYTITCRDGRSQSIKYHVHTREYMSTSDGTRFPHFNVAAERACRQ